MQRTISMSKKRKVRDTSRAPFKKSKRMRPTPITGNVNAASTTLARAVTPFPLSRFVTFEYRNGLVSRVPGASLDSILYACNDMTDFDRTTFSGLGNKQPLFYDALIGSNGPYKQYQVISWYTEFTIINRGTAPITMWLCPPSLSQTEFDTTSEADNYPGVIKKYVDVPGGQAIVTISNRGHMKDVVSGFQGDSNFVGFQTSPTTPVFGSLVLSSTSSLSYEVAILNRAYTKLTAVDAIIS